MVLCLEMYDEPVESLWVRISRQTNVCGVVVHTCCRLPDQAEADEAFCRQAEDSLCSQASVLLGDSNCLSCCKGNTAGHRQSRTLLDCAGYNFLTCVIEEFMRKGPLLDLIQTMKKQLEMGRSGTALGAVTMRQWDDRVEDSERTELGEKWDHSPGVQESLKTCLRICLEESCRLRS